MQQAREENRVSRRRPRSRWLSCTFLGFLVLPAAWAQGNNPILETLKDLRERQTQEDQRAFDNARTLELERQRQQLLELERERLRLETDRSSPQANGGAGTDQISPEDLRSAIQRSVARLTRRFSDFAIYEEHIARLSGILTLNARFSADDDLDLTVDKYLESLYQIAKHATFSRKDLNLGNRGISEPLR